MTSRKNIKIFDFNGVNLPSTGMWRGEVFAISDCLVDTVFSRSIQVHGRVQWRIQVLRLRGSTCLGLHPPPYWEVSLKPLWKSILVLFRISNCTPPPLELFSWSHYKSLCLRSTPHGIMGDAHSRIKTHPTYWKGGPGPSPPWIRPWSTRQPRGTYVELVMVINVRHTLFWIFIWSRVNIMLGVR